VSRSARLPLDPAAPSPRAGRRPDPRPARSLERLHTAVIELAAEHGINATTVDDIAAAARVSKGTVYNNVSSKEELFTGAMVDGIDRVAAALGEAVSGRRGSDGVRAAVVTLLGRVAASPDFARLFLAEAWRPGRPWHGELRQARGRVVGVLADVVRDAGDPPQDPELAATVMLGSAVVAGLDLVADGRPVPAQRLEAVTDQLLALFAAAGSAHRGER
jgi:AcrR family transcriptional regulator